MLLERTGHKSPFVLKSPPFRGALASSWVMALSGLGDAILYPLLPVYGATLGFSALNVGLLLSVNRFVRILANTSIANAIGKIGMKRIIVYSSTLAVITTISYGIEIGFITFLFARIVWGLSYSGLKISTLNYAAKVTNRKGLTFGTSESIKSLGALSALGLGPILMAQMGLQMGFFILGCIGLLGILVALTLPKLDFDSEKVCTKKTFSPTPLHLLVGMLSITIDGILVVTVADLLGEQAFEAHILLSTVALYLLLKRLFMTGLSLLGGFLTLMVPVLKLFNVAVVLCLFSLASIAVGFVEWGLIMAFAFNAVVVTFSPQVALAGKERNHLQAISSISTWWDMGSAIGALLGILMLGRLGREFLFLGLTMITTLLFINFIVRTWKKK